MLAQRRHQEGREPEGSFHGWHAAIESAGARSYPAPQILCRWPILPHRAVPVEMGSPGQPQNDPKAHLFQAIVYQALMRMNGRQ